MARLVVGTSANSTTPALVAEKQPVISSLSVTPTTSAQTITAPTGTDGYSPVNVSAVTSSIDANITAGNIKNGVTILGVTGNYAGVTPSGTLNISANGTYDVTNYASASVQVSGGGATQFGINLKGWCGDVDLNDTGGFRTDQAVGTLSAPQLLWLNMWEWYGKFKGSTGLVGAVDLSGVSRILEGTLEMAFQNTRITSLDLSGATDIEQEGMASCCADNPVLTSVDISGVGNVGPRGLFYAFENCTSLTSLNVDGIYGFTSSVLEGPNECLSGMCCYCTALRNLYFTSLNASAFTTIADDYGMQASEVFSMIMPSMIAGCTNCTVHFDQYFGQDILAWDAASANPEFSTVQDVAASILAYIEQGSGVGNSVVFDIDPT